MIDMFGTSPARESETLRSIIRKIYNVNYVHFWHIHLTHFRWYFGMVMNDVAWNLAFPVFISPIVRKMCDNLHYESVYFKELHNQQEYYWPTIYRTGAAVVSTITSCNVMVI